MKPMLALGSAGAVAVVAMAIWTSAIAPIPSIEHRAFGFLLCAAVALLCRYNIVARAPKDSVRSGWWWLLDAAIIGALAVATIGYPAMVERIEYEFYELSGWDTVIAFSAIAALMEIGRRIWGWPLFLVTSGFLLYMVFGEYAPGAFAHTPFNWQQLAVTLWYSYQGVFGTILGIVLNIVVIFVFFGAMLEATGAGDSLVKIAFALTGRTRGGPAHAAIVASGLFGTMSGSTVANVVGTGTFTIPMIKKRGFTPEFAGGVEATASSGGQIVPPVMGAAAFVMADLIGIPYLLIIVAAIVPAALYYFNLFLGVSLEARRKGIEPIPVAERETVSPTDIVRSLQFLLPIAAVIAVLVMGRSVPYAGFVATMTAIVLGFLLNPELRRNPGTLVNGFVKAGINASTVIVAISMMGIIIGTMDATGAGLKFASYIEYLGQGNLLLSLVLSMIGALMLGMGMPTLPAYLIIILVLGPAIEQMGLSALVVHMFVFYYGVASSITPPVALAAYAAAPIAESNPLRTALMAVRLGAAKFIVPFVFAFNPSLLLIENFAFAEFASALLRSIIAFYLLATALAGFDKDRVAGFAIGFRVLAAVLLLLVWPVSQAAGFVLAAVLLIGHRRSVAARENAVAGG